MEIACDKSSAAVRQLDVAIGLLFADGDPLAVRTLAGAAYGIIADLAENRESGSSWRTKIVRGSGLSEKEGLRVLNAAQNYLKHADKDAEKILSFDEEENDDLIFVASIECGLIGQKLPLSMQAYQIWYLAMYPDHIGHKTAPVMIALEAFPGLSEKGRTEQLSLGHKFLNQVLEGNLL